MKRARDGRMVTNNMFMTIGPGCTTMILSFVSTALEVKSLLITCQYLMKHYRKAMNELWTTRLLPRLGIGIQATIVQTKMCLSLHRIGGHLWDGLCEFCSSTAKVLALSIPIGVLICNNCISTYTTVASKYLLQLIGSAHMRTIPFISGACPRYFVNSHSGFVDTSASLTSIVNSYGFENLEDAYAKLQTITVRHMRVLGQDLGKHYFKDFNSVHTRQISTLCTEFKKKAEDLILWESDAVWDAIRKHRFDTNDWDATLTLSKELVIPNVTPKMLALVTKIQYMDVIFAVRYATAPTYRRVINDILPYGDFSARVHTVAWFNQKVTAFQEITNRFVNMQSRLPAALHVYRRDDTPYYQEGNSFDRWISTVVKASCASMGSDVKEIVTRLLLEEDISWSAARKALSSKTMRSYKSKTLADVLPDLDFYRRTPHCTIEDTGFTKAVLKLFPTTGRSTQNLLQSDIERLLQPKKRFYVLNTRHFREIINDILNYRHTQFELFCWEEMDKIAVGNLLPRAYEFGNKFTFFDQTVIAVLELAEFKASRLE